MCSLSRPSRARGLKLNVGTQPRISNVVAPFAGAWIETVGQGYVYAQCEVAPFAGAWIETLFVSSMELVIWVAPFAGAWIETSYIVFVKVMLKRRALRGRVD